MIKASESDVTSGSAAFFFNHFCLRSLTWVPVVHEDLIFSRILRSFFALRTCFGEIRRSSFFLGSASRSSSNDGRKATRKCPLCWEETKCLPSIMDILLRNNEKAVLPHYVPQVDECRPIGQSPWTCHIVMRQEKAQHACDRLTRRLGR